MPTAGTSHIRVISAAMDMPPLASHQPTPMVPTADGFQAWHQRRETLKDTIRQLADTVNALV